MTIPAEEVCVPVNADTSHFKDAMEDLSKQSDRFAAGITRTLQNAIISGKSFSDTLRAIGMQFATMALNQGLKPLEGVLSGAMSSLFSSIGGGGVPIFANGGVVNTNGIVPFASGGVVATPTYFQAGNQTGLMGEAGAEAILPLSRGTDGKLGVQAQTSTSAPNIVFNVSTPNVESFRKSEAQVSAMLARAVGRGRRSL